MITSEFVGDSIGNIEQLLESKIKLKPLVTNSFVGLDGKNHFAMTFPIVDNSKYLGQVGVIFSSDTFFQNYSLEAQNNFSNLIVLDRNHVIVSHPRTDFVGYTAEHPYVEHSLSPQNIQQRQLFLKDVFAGKKSTYIDNLLGEERLVINDFVRQGNMPVFYLLYSLPTKFIHSQTNSILFNLFVTEWFLLAGISISSFLSLLYLKKNKERESDTKRLSAIGELSARLAHDIRNPLSVIVNSLELLKHKTQNSLQEEELNYIKMMEGAVHRIRRQVDEVLDFVRKKPIALKNKSLLEVLDNALQHCNVPPNIKIILPKKDIFITCDPEQMRVLFTNLITNAVQAIGDKQGTIEIRYFDDTKNLVIEIEDSGPGIPKKIIPKIFDLLFTTKQQGTGLGLVSCKTIVKEHHGTIMAENSPKGGALFRITLPKLIECLIRHYIMD